MRFVAEKRPKLLPEALEALSQVGIRPTSSTSTELQGQVVVDLGISPEDEAAVEEAMKALGWTLEPTPI